MQPLAVVQVDAQVRRVEQLAGDGQDVAVRRDEDAGAVGVQAAEAAGAEQLHQLLVDLLGDLVERVGRARPAAEQRRARRQAEQAQIDALYRVAWSSDRT